MSTNCQNMFMPTVVEEKGTELLTGSDTGLKKRKIKLIRKLSEYLKIDNKAQLKLLTDFCSKTEYKALCFFFVVRDYKRGVKVKTLQHRYTLSRGDVNAALKANGIDICYPYKKSFCEPISFDDVMARV